MEFLAEALEKYSKNAAPNIIKIGNNTYSDKPLEKCDTETLPYSLKICSLDSLVDYLTYSVENDGFQKLIHIVSPICVRLLGPINADGNRAKYIEVNADIPHFDFNRYLGVEEFLVGTQAKFIEDGNLKAVQTFVGTVEHGTIGQYSDDGISQKATIKTGIVSKGDAIVPNPVTLRPYRTFYEVEQPSSRFVFRMKEERDLISAALFDADGDAWTIKATHNIKSYLEKALEDANIANCLILL